MKNWPWYGHLVLAAAFFGLFFFFYYKPHQADLAGLQEERIALDRELQTLRAKKLELDTIEAELDFMRRTLKDLEAIIPEKREIAEILRRIQQLAYDSRLNVIRFEEKGELHKDYYSEWPCPIVVSGAYHNLGLFFESLNRLPRLFTVENFDLKTVQDQSDATTITASWTAKTYTFSEEAPPAPAPAKTTARR